MHELGLIKYYSPMYNVVSNHIRILHQNKRRLYLLTFILAISVNISFAQFTVHYNELTNSIQVLYDECANTCIYPPSEEANCRCVPNCSSNETDFFDDYMECLDVCSEDHLQQDYNAALYDLCVQQCEQTYDADVASCENSCTASTPIGTVTSYAYFLIAAWAEIPNDPRTGSNWNTGSQVIRNSSDIQIQDRQLPESWRNIYGKKNTCYGITISFTIQLPDGSQVFCHRDEWYCDFVG